MTEEKCTSSEHELKIREIEGSLREGKLMIQVLRSLPSSENNDAFIQRFEELIQGLEQYGSSSNLSERDKISSADLREQLEALKRRQENVRALLVETSGDNKIQLAKLTDLIDEANRFESMVSRLLDITQRAHLTEASNSLTDILTRFHELRRTLGSLRETYEAVTEDSQLSKDSRHCQLASFQEFLSKLSLSLESTKECFFTIYHMVKTNIETGMLDGSLKVTDSNVDQEVEQPSVVTLESKETSEVPMAMSSALTDSSLLESQRAHLIALQDQTKAERQEIDRLLKQRDDLLHRLSTLKVTTATSTDDSTSLLLLLDLKQEPDAPTHATSSTSVEVKDGTSETSALEALLFIELESKRRELEKLKSQLSLLCPIEEKRVVPHSSTPAATNEPVVATTLSEPSNMLPEQQRSFRSIRPSPSPAFSSLTEKATSGTNAVATTLGNSVQTITQKLDCVTFQQPEAVCINDNTERLYENMREARIRMEEQRGKIAPARLVPDIGGASIANSQDRTTSATWGGSSPVPSSSSSGGSLGANNEQDGMPNAVENGLPETSKCDILLNGMVSQLISSKRNHLRTHYASCNGNTTRINLLRPVDTSVVMPQLGRSPSPTRAGATVDGLMGEEVDGPSHPITESDDTHPVLTHRVQMLETSIVQLYQICRYLVLENTQLNAMISRPSFGPHSTSYSMEGVNIPNPNAAFVAPHLRLPSSPPVLQSVGIQQQEHLQTCLAQLLQHQATYLNAQHDFQSALRQSRLQSQQQQQQQLSLSIASNLPQLNSFPNQQLMSPSTAVYNNVNSIYSTTASLSGASTATDTGRVGMGPWMSAQPQLHDPTGMASWNWSLPPPSSAAFAYSGMPSTCLCPVPESNYPTNIGTDPAVRLNSPLHPSVINSRPASGNALAAAMELLNQMWTQSPSASAPQTSL